MGYGSEDGGSTDAICGHQQDVWTDGGVCQVRDDRAKKSGRTEPSLRELWVFGHVQGFFRSVGECVRTSKRCRTAEERLADETKAQRTAVQKKAAQRVNEITKRRCITKYSGQQPADGCTPIDTGTTNVGSAAHQDRGESKREAIANDAERRPGATDAEG